MSQTPSFPVLDLGLNIPWDVGLVPQSLVQGPPGELGRLGPHSSPAKSELVFLTSSGRFMSALKFEKHWARAGGFPGGKGRGMITLLMNTGIFAIFLGFWEHQQR